MGTPEETDDNSLLFSPDTGGSIEYKEDETVIVEGVDPETGDATFTTISDPVYNYTTDEETGAGYYTITGSIEECEDFVLGFNAETVYSGSEDCGFLAVMGEEGGFLATEDSFTVGNDDVYIVFMEDSAEFGSTVTGSSFTVSDLVSEFTEGSDDDAAEGGVMVTNAGGGTITFTVSTVTLTSVDDDDKDLIITDPVYSYMEDKGVFTITGPTEDCDDFGLAFNADGLVMGSIDCDFSLSVGDLSMDDEMMMGDDDATDDAIDDDALVGAIVDEMLMGDDDATDDAIDDDALVGAIV